MNGSKRTPEEIRREIRTERAHLDAAISDLSTDARRTGRMAGSAFAALTGLVVVRKLLRRKKN